MHESSLWRIRATLAHSILPSSPPHFQILRANSQYTHARTSHQVQSLSTDSWSGLNSWRSSGSDERRHWGAKGPEAPPPQLTDNNNSHIPKEPLPPAPTLAECGRAVLITPDPRLKAELTHAAWRAHLAGTLPIGEASAPSRPARPVKPDLLPARRIPTPKQSPLPLNVYTLHNLAHVELNAIDLAWDTVVRFSPLRLPPKFYSDFARVADDESRHLGWCLQRLEELGYEYGCMPAHDLLWEGCAASSGAVRDRLAVVPMAQEARGLDAGTRLAERLVGWGDNKAAAIVARISEEERAHVAVGVSWFTAVCEAQEVPPQEAFAEALLRLCPDLLKGQFNHDERKVVGLLREWYDESCWPEELKNKSAAEANHSTGSNNTSGGGREQVLAIDELRLRLEALVATEIQAAA